MMNWFKRRRKTLVPTAAVLRGAPVRARVKTYSGETGHAYQYVYRGWRESPAAAGIEHVFEVSRGSEWKDAIAVMLAKAELDRCEAEIGRPLLSAERYALAKLSLIEAFDRANDSGELQSAIAPSATDMVAHLVALGRV